MNPYAVLRLPEDIEDDETVRQAWLEGVRLHPPETAPEQFARLREAYEMVQDRESRFRLRTFGDRRYRNLDILLELFPLERNHTGPAPWLAVTRGGRV